MAVANYSKKCSSCGGNKWEYIREQKLWVCRYCGAQVERREEYDGLYTIKNVVRQVIVDAAYRRMEQADRNLSECQKINARYCGSLVAGICFRLIAAVEGTLPGQDPRALLGQLRRDYQLLTEEGREMGDDETALYEFLDSSDAWAALAMAFDTVGDEQRREYLMTLTDVSQVFSKYTNMSLLRFALKQNRIELAEQILKNRDNIDQKDALCTVLSGCADGEKKGQMAAGLLAGGALKPEENELVEDYLSGSDSVSTKSQIALAAMRTGMTLHLEVVSREVMAGADTALLREMLAALFTRRLYDGELELLMSFAAAQKDAEKCKIVLDAMSSAGQFVSLNARQTLAFLHNAQFTPEERASIVSCLHTFSPQDRMWESVAGEYLCGGRESAENRGKILNILCRDVKSVPARDFENYVMTSTLDGEAKTDRIRMLLELPDMNAGFFRGLAGKYLQRGAEAPEERRAVLNQLLSSGLSIDGTVLIDYVCSAADSPDNKVELVQLALKNGTMLRSDALSIYLERCADMFASELFALLYTPASTVTQKALENYVLHCRDAVSVKTGNARTLATRMGIPFGSSECTVRFGGSRIKCQLAQGYLLTSADAANEVYAMITAMTASGTRLNSDIQVDGRSKKFSKYVTEVRSTLSAAAEQICQEHRLFSRFF